MRSVKARGRARPNIVIDAIAGALSFAAFIVLVAALATSTLLLFKKERPQPVSVVILEDQNQSAPNGNTRVVLANQDDRGYVLSGRIEVFKNGSWLYAPVETAAASLPDELRPKAQYSLSVPAPPEGSAWRVNLTGKRAMGEFEAGLAWMFDCVKLKYPFGHAFNVVGPEVLIRRDEIPPAGLNPEILSAHRSP